MTWNIKFNSKFKFIELSYVGLVSPAELNEALLAAAALSKEKQTLDFFADCSELAGGHSIMDLYALISLFESTGVRGLKEAIIFPSLQATIEDVKFYETACLNRGYNVRVFANRQEALTWLTT